MLFPYKEAFSGQRCLYRFIVRDGGVSFVSMFDMARGVRAMGEYLIARRASSYLYRYFGLQPFLRDAIWKELKRLL